MHRQRHIIITPPPLAHHEGQMIGQWNAGNPLIRRPQVCSLARDNSVDIRDNRDICEKPQAGESRPERRKSDMRGTRGMRLAGRNVNITKRRGRRGVTILGAAATLVLVSAAPASAFAPVGGAALGFGSMVFDDTAATRVTECQNKFSGHVTRNEGHGQGGEISIDDISFTPCDPEAGISVFANNLPWTLKLDSRANLVVEGVDLDVVKRGGSCHYSGTLEGARSFDGVFTVFGALTRQSNGCDGPGRLGLSVLAESISVNGVALSP
jgi:hypothetical protein